MLQNPKTKNVLNIIIKIINNETLADSLGILIVLFWYDHRLVYLIDGTTVGRFDGHWRVQ